MTSKVELVRLVLKDVLRVQITEAEAEKVLERIEALHEKEAVEQPLAPDEGYECRCNAEHAHMTYIPHEEGCPARLRR